VKPEIIAAGAGRYVRVEASQAGRLREYLLGHGVPCAAPEPPQGRFRLIRLGNTVNVGVVQAILDHWGTPGRRHTA
jgi:hypothetical protein